MESRAGQDAEDAGTGKKPCTPGPDEAAVAAAAGGGGAVAAHIIFLGAVCSDCACVSLQHQGATSGLSVPSRHRDL